MSKAISPLSLERYELKYHVPEELVKPLSAAVEVYCYMDYYSQISSDQFYTINSLYFDTPRFHFLENKMSDQYNRFCMRVRSYSDQPKAPYFFEVKNKVGEILRKKRAKVATEDWARLLTHGEFPEDMDEYSLGLAKTFYGLTVKYNASPKILTQYRRKAYISSVDDYARITFDKNLRYQYEWDYNVKPDDDLMVPYDNENLFSEPYHNVILEIKCTKKVPMWIIDLIRDFQLVRSSFSKYGSSFLESHDMEYMASVAQAIPNYRTISY
jgi:SPX domain protein involved in polyphosphate accumulation